MNDISAAGSAAQRRQVEVREGRAVRDVALPGRGGRQAGGFSFGGISPNGRASFFLLVCLFVCLTWKLAHAPGTQRR